MPCPVICVKVVVGEAVLPLTCVACSTPWTWTAMGHTTTSTFMSALNLNGC